MYRLALESESHRSVLMSGSPQQAPRTPSCRELSVDLPGNISEWTHWDGKKGMAFIQQLLSLMGGWLLGWEYLALCPSLHLCQVHSHGKRRTLGWETLEAIHTVCRQPLSRPRDSAKALPAPTTGRSRIGTMDKGNRPVKEATGRRRGCAKLENTRSA